MTNISLYMVPCMDSSAYAINNNIMCGTPDAQIAKIVTTLDSYGMEFIVNTKRTWSPTPRPTYQSATPKPTGQPTTQPSRQPSSKPSHQPSNQPSSKPSNQPSSKPTFFNRNIPTRSPTLSPTRSPTCSPTRSPTRSPTQRPTQRPTPRPSTQRPTIQTITIKHLFMLVEDYTPNRFFDSNATANAAFLHGLAHAAFLKGIKFGISTTRYDFENVYFKNRKDRKNKLAQTLLWLPRFDGIDSMLGVEIFGGFSSIYMKQTSGGSTDLRLTGSNRVGYNYVVDINEKHKNYTDVYTLGLI